MEPSPQRGDMFTGENSAAGKYTLSCLFVSQLSRALRFWLNSAGDPAALPLQFPYYFPLACLSSAVFARTDSESGSVELLYHGRLNTNLSTLFLSPSIPFPRLITLVCATFWVTEDFSDLSDFFRNKSFMSMLKNAATTEKGKFFSVYPHPRKTKLMFCFFFPQNWGYLLSPKSCLYKYRRK